MESDIYLKFNGETLGLLTKQSGFGTTCGAQPISKQGNGGKIGETLVNVTGPIVRTPSSFSVRLDDLVESLDYVDTVQYVADMQRRLIGTKGVLEIVDGTGKAAVIGNPQVCNSLNWSGAVDGLTYLVMNLGFTGGAEEGNRFFEPLLNGGFEVLGEGTNKDQAWGWALGSDAETVTLLGTESFGSGQFCVKLPCNYTGSTTICAQTVASKGSFGSGDYTSRGLQVTVTAKLDNPTTIYTRKGIISLKMLNFSSSSIIATKNFVILNNRTTDYTITVPISSVYSTGGYTIHIGNNNEGDLYIDNVEVKEVTY